MSTTVPTARQKEFGRRVRERRLELGLSQEALALKARIDRSYVAQLEAGRRNVALENICKLAAALRVDAGELTAGLQSRRGRTE